jgi:heptosyltransferase-3/putative inorganic carbon (HCO3(-)) transporter
MRQGSDPTTAVDQTTEPGTVREGAVQGAWSVLWKIEGYGLLLITGLSFFPRWFHWQEYLFFALLLIALIAAGREGLAIWTRTPIDLPLLLFIGWVLVTVPFAIDPAYSFSEWRKLVAQVLVFYWALLVMRAQRDPRSTMRGVLAAIAMGTAALALYALMDFLARGGTWRDRSVRASAPSSDYNWLSTYMVMALPILVSMALLARTWWSRIVCWVSAGLALLAQVISYTRAGWLGLVAEVMAWGLLVRRPRLALWAAGGSLAALLLFLGAVRLGYQQGTADPGTLKARVAVWQLGLTAIADHPLVGIGYGDYTFMKRFGDRPETTKANGLHNTFLMVAMGSGLPALCLLVWVLGQGVKTLVSRAWQTSDRERKVLLIAIALMIIGFAVRNLFDHMLAGSLAALFWILLALGIVLATPGHSGVDRLARRSKLGWRLTYGPGLSRPRP